MKKVICLVALALLAMGMSYGGTLTLLSPSGGEVCLGEKVPIKWTATGINVKVKVQLLNYSGTGFVGWIASNLDASASPINWTVAPPVVAGTSYRIRVMTMDNTVKGMSPNAFLVKRCPKDQLIPPSLTSTVQRLQQPTTLSQYNPPPPPPPANLPVIGKFVVTPQLAKPGDSIYFYFEHRNAIKAKIFKLNGNNRGAEIFTYSGFGSHGSTNQQYNAEQATGKYGFELELENGIGTTLARCWLTVRPEMKILYFQANSSAYKMGEKIVFSYCFTGAEEAIIKKIGDESSRESIPVCSGLRCEDKFNYTFRGPGTYKLFIKNSYDPVLASIDIVLTQAE